MDYDEARRTLATAMRWEGLEVREWARGEALTGFPPLGWRVAASFPAWNPDTTEEMRRQYMAWDQGRSVVPDPLNDAEDLERLEAWLAERWEVETHNLPNAFHVVLWQQVPSGRGVWAREQKHSHYAYANEEPDPVRRRRLAIVHVAWQAATADQHAGGAA